MSLTRSDLGDERKLLLTMSAASEDEIRKGPQYLTHKTHLVPDVVITRLLR